MALETILTEIQGRLTLEHFPSEAAVKQGIVLPILRELNWDTDNPMVVRPEYTAGKGKVDFALCERSGSGSPKVFIEVKGLGGETEDAVEQAMQYAFKAGVRFVVLTDGRTWSVYLPAEEGSYEERRVFKLDLSEHPPQKSSEFLQCYLKESRVVSDEALEVALRDLGDRRRLEKARKAIPDAWRDIFEASEPDKSLNLLVNVLAERVESKGEVRPADNDVVDFFRSLQGSTDSPKTGLKWPEPPPPEPEDPPVGGPRPRVRIKNLVILGRPYSYRSQSEAMAIVFKKLQEEDPEFLQRFYEHPQNKSYWGRRRRYLGRNQRELFGDNVKKPRSHEPIDRGWVISTNYNWWTSKKRIIQLATKVAGLKFGRDIIINFDA